MYYKILKFVSNKYNKWYDKKHINKWFTEVPQKDKIFLTIEKYFKIKLDEDAIKNIKW